MSLPTYSSILRRMLLGRINLVASTEGGPSGTIGNLTPSQRDRIALPNHKMQSARAGKDQLIFECELLPPRHSALFFVLASP